MGFEGYDDWKAREPDPSEDISICSECGHREGANYCDCPCCHEPEDCESDLLKAAKLGLSYVLAAQPSLTTQPNRDADIIRAAIDKAEAEDGVGNSELLRLLKQAGLHLDCCKGQDYPLAAEIAAAIAKVEAE